MILIILLYGSQVRPAIGLPLPEILRHHCSNASYRQGGLWVTDFVTELVCQFHHWKPISDTEDVWFRLHTFPYQKFNLIESRKFPLNWVLISSPNLFESSLTVHSPSISPFHISPSCFPLHGPPLIYPYFFLKDLKCYWHLTY